MKHAAYQGALAIVLLYTTVYQAAFADTTLLYKLIVPKQEDKPQLTQQLNYQLKQHQIRITQQGSSRISLYDRQRQQFTSFDPQTDNVSVINREILLQRVSQLKQKTREHIRQVEAELNSKMQTMTAQEKEIGEDLLNQLKHPDLYGEHTQLKLIADNKQKTIQGINCMTYRLIKQSEKLKEYCISKASELKLTEAEYQTLRSLYKFEYDMQSQLSFALGKSNFELIDLNKEKVPGIIIEQIDFRQGKPIKHIILKGADESTLDKQLFELKQPAKK